MTKTRQRPKIGDILQLRDGDRFAYLHYIGRHPEYGDAVLVSPKFQDRQISVAGDYFADAYATFYPVTLAVAQGLAEVISQLPSPGLPKRMRRPGAMTGNRVDTWIIEEGGREIVRATLSDDERRLPIAGIWNHAILIQRIGEGWTPINYLDAA